MTALVSDTTTGLWNTTWRWIWPTQPATWSPTWGPKPTTSSPPPTWGCSNWLRRSWSGSSSSPATAWSLQRRLRTQFLCPRNVTDEQEGFADGFVRALAELHHQHIPSVTSAPQTTINNSMAPVASMAGGAVYSSSMRSDPPVYADLNSFSPAISTTNPAMNYTSAPPQHTVQHPRLRALKEEPPNGARDAPARRHLSPPSTWRARSGLKPRESAWGTGSPRPNAGRGNWRGFSRLEDKVKNLKSQKLRAGVHRKHAARASGPAQAESHEPRQQRLPAHVDTTAADVLRRTEGHLSTL